LAIWGISTQAASLKDYLAIFPDWLDKSHLLLKVMGEDGKEYMVSFDIKTEKITYLFNKR
jgi:hypothetical protein